MEDVKEILRRQEKARRRRAQRQSENSALTGAEGVDAAKEAALTILDRCDQSVYGCRKKLLERGYRPEVVDLALDRLVEVGILDDFRYACALVRERHRARGLVGRALREDLQRKGLNAEVVERAILTELPLPADTAVVDQLVLKKLQASRKLPIEVQDRRIVGMLMRRGYSAGQAFAALERVRESQVEA